MISKLPLQLSMRSFEWCGYYRLRPLQLRRAAGPGAPRLSTCAGLQPGEVGETREGR